MKSNNLITCVVVVICINLFALQCVSAAPSDSSAPIDETPAPNDCNSGVWSSFNSDSNAVNCGGSLTTTEASANGNVAGPSPIEEFNNQDTPQEASHVDSGSPSNSDGNQAASPTTTLAPVVGASSSMANDCSSSYYKSAATVYTMMTICLVITRLFNKWQ